jgi:MFS transporter, FSR family, fosmidomycin resistance protein
MGPGRRHGAWRPIAPPGPRAALRRFVDSSSPVEQDSAALPTPALSDPPVAAAGAARTPVALSLAVLAGAHLAVDCFTAVWPVYKTVAALDLVRAGLIATVASMMANGLQVVFGVIADRGGAKTLLLLGVLGAGSVALLPYVSSYPAMFALVATSAICSAAFHPTGTGAAGALTRQRTGVFVAVFLVGGYLGYASSQLVFTSVYRLTHGGTAVLLPVSIVAALLVARLVPRSTAPAPQSLAAWGRAVRAVARGLWPLFAIQVCAGAATMSVVFLLPDLLQSRGAPHWMVEGGGHLMYVCGACLALIPAGYLSDRLGARRVLVLTNLVSGVALLLALREGQSPWTLLLLIATFGALNGCNPVIAISEGNRVMPGQSSGASALLMGLPACLSALAPAIAAALAAPARGGTPAGALRWMALCVPATFLFCLLLPRATRAPTPRPPQPGAPAPQ